MSPKEMLAAVLWRREPPEMTKEVGNAQTLGFAIGGVVGISIAGLYFPSQPMRTVVFGTMMAIGAYSGRAIGLVAATRKSEALAHALHVAYKLTFAAALTCVIAVLCYAAVAGDSLFAIVGMALAGGLTVFPASKRLNRWLGVFDVALAAGLFVLYFRTHDYFAVWGIALCALAAGFSLGKATPEQGRSRT